MKKTLLPLALLAMLAGTSCNGGDPTAYTVTGQGNDSTYNGKIYLMNSFNTREIIDSADVVNGKFTFEGKIEKPVMALVNARNAGITGMFVLEPGEITFTNNSNTAGEGTPLNAELKAYTEKMNAVFEETGNDIDAATPKLKEITADVVARNNNNVIAVMALYQSEYMIGVNDILAMLETCGPEVKENPAIVSKMKNWEAKAKTSAGMMFTDFTVEYNGQKTSLSDYVGKGKYVLVDFWASWCGPCRRAIPGIKELYEKYKGDKFEVLGVATWDEPEATLKAIEELELPWPQIINAQKIGSDAYGVAGIPQIILFAPDGTIVARDLHGEQLKNKVDEVMSK
jgi:thiol-disulfide isomerase/thioredoxin